LLWQNAANFAPKRRGASPAPANAVRIRNACDDIDGVELLPRVQLPTLVLRCRHDNGAPFEQNRLLARSIPRAKFVTIESDNHAALAGGPAWLGLISEIAAFLAE
jgi:pimeloyl-ACP methyl ester carboxylesterase